eukprot:scaffold998_cov411-Prasinococcus_capsulatus_cf.AAC.10
MWGCCSFHPLAGRRIVAARPWGGSPYPDEAGACFRRVACVERRTPHVVVGVAATAPAGGRGAQSTRRTGSSGGSTRPGSDLYGSG